MRLFPGFENELLRAAGIALVAAAATGCGDSGAAAVDTPAECNPLGGIGCSTGVGAAANASDAPDETRSAQLPPALRDLWSVKPAA